MKLAGLLLGPAFLLVAESPFAPGAKPVNLGSVGAGEGPAWNPKDGLYFSGGGRISRRGLDGKVQVFREQSGSANGLLWDPQGRLVVCESRGRRVTRIETDGSITVLADQYQGSRFNSPNDLTIDLKGRIYFTDPRYGSRDGMEIRGSDGREIEGVYRIDAPGKVTLLRTGLERPNGILVAPLDRFLYVADNNNNKEGGARKLWRFPLAGDGSVDPAGRKLIFDWEDSRGPDGVKMDRGGRLFVAAGLNQPHPPFETDRRKGGIYVLSPEGVLIEFLPIPVDEVTNCAFGGPTLRTLFITAGGTLWSIDVRTPGRVPYMSK